MDEETKKYIDAEARSKNFALDMTQKYAKADTWFQKYRRDHSLAFQNILIFGYGPALFAIGLAVGKFLK